MDCNKLELKNLYRTLKTKHVPYFTDGTGRDRYIGYNNGGFFNPRSYNSVDPKVARTTGTTLYTSLNNITRNPSIKAPNFKYHSDGNGRDQYIVVNGGGLFYETKPLNLYKLTDFLRGGENYRMNNTTVVNGKTRVSLSEMKYLKYLRNKEKDIINRLYTKEKEKFLKKKIKENYDEISQVFNNENCTTAPNEFIFNKTSTTPAIKDNKNNRVEKMNNLFTESIPAIKPNIHTRIISQTEENTINDRKLILNKIGNNDNRIPKRRNKIVGNKTEINFLDDIDRINKYGFNKSLKKINYTFKQPYLHLTNVSVSPEKE